MIRKEVLPTLKTSRLEKWGSAVWLGGHTGVLLNCVGHMLYLSHSID